MAELTGTSQSAPGDESVAAPAQERKLRKIAIVGGGPGRMKAPFKDRSWEIWAFSSRRGRLPRISRWFEIHAMTDLRQQLAGKKKGRRSYRNYMRFMRRLKCPVYMRKAYRRIPKSVKFPLDPLLERFGRIFTSTASYMIALAIVEGCDVIGLWGVNLDRREYWRQRPAIRYLLAVARQNGIKLVLPRRFPMKIPATPPRVKKTRVLYAYDWRKRGAWWRERVRRRLRRKRRLRRRRRR